MCILAVHFTGILCVHVCNKSDNDSKERNNISISSETKPIGYVCTLERV